jgi:hypothetical protein
MDIVESGYKFKLDSFMGTFPQEIRFTQKLLTGEFIDGTTNEEVINMLIARFYALQGKNPSPENQCIIIMLKSIKELLSKRLNKKIKRNETKEENIKDQWRTESEGLFKNFERSFRTDSSRDRGTGRAN